MAEFKLTIGVKDGKTVQKEVKEAEANAFLGKKLGETVKGDAAGFAGYEFQITGGSDYCGFPMRKDVEGTSRKRILITQGTGMRNKRKGLRLRKTIAGNTVYEQTAQINLKVTKEGPNPLVEVPAEEGEAEQKE